MQIALIGDHPDGLAMAHALAAIDSYSLAIYAGPAAGAEKLRRLGFAGDTLNELEEVLARSDIDIVIVGDDFKHRPQSLRRAVQSEKHVLCVHPFDLLPDVGYEVAMIQEETKKLLLPLLPERLHPALILLKQIIDSGTLGRVAMIECERHFTPSAVRSDAAWETSPLASLWDSLRFLTGDVQELSALAASAAGLQPHDQVTLTGRCASGTLFQFTLLPRAGGNAIRLCVRGDKGEAELHLPHGFTGPSSIRYPAAHGQDSETWEAQNLWRSLAGAVAIALGRRDRRDLPTWHDAIRCLELFEAARKSAKRKRVISMQYEEFTEESNFKSVMTALGCGLLVFLMLLLFIAPLAPWILYVSLPLLALFLGLQIFRGIVPKERKQDGRNAG